MIRSARLAPLLALAALLAPSTTRAAVTYTFADLGPTPWVGSSVTSAMLSHASRPTLDEQGGVTFGVLPDALDRALPGIPLSRIDAPFTPLYGGLRPEVPDTGYRVGYVAGPGPGGPWRALVWDQASGTGKALGVPISPDLASVATDVNRSGQVVGHISSASGNGVSRPAAWTADGTPWDPFAGLPASAFGLHSQAYGLNDAGDIVGRFRGDTSPSYYSADDRPHAFLLAGGQLADLNDLVALDSGWLLESATDINTAGQITGIARNPSGVFRTFLLTPAPVPEPATLVVLSAGVFLTLARRQWHLRRTV